MNVDVYISNISEDVWDFIDTLTGEEKKFEIDENAFLSDRELLILNPQHRSVIILPKKLDPIFVDYYKKIFNNDTVDIWVPAEHSGKTCEDILKDQEIWKKLISLGKSSTLVLKSYSSSKQFLNLIEHLRKAGCTVSTPESPSADAWWTVDHFGSKSGVRETVQELMSSVGEKWMTSGEVLKSIPEAVDVATKYYLQKNGVVIKTNKAHSGAGVVIVSPNTLAKDERECEKYFNDLFKTHAYWSKFPIVVEEYIDIDESVGGGNPNCEYRVTEIGEVQLLYMCGMRVTADGIFKGVAVNNSIFSPELAQKLLLFGSRLGETYAKAGYRGYYDVDCIYTKSGELLITESNVRKTGGTHVYHAGIILLGKNFGDSHYLLSNNTHPLPPGTSFSFAELLSKLEPLLFTKEKGEGILLASSNILRQGKLSHIIIGNDEKRAHALERKMEDLLAR